MVFAVLFGFFGLPPIMKGQAIKQLSSRLGREVTLEKLRINPLVLSVTVEGFAIAEGGEGGGEFTGWDRLYVNLDTWPLVVGRVRFSEIELDGFRARVAKGADGGFNYDDILARLAGGSGEDAGDEEAKPTPLAIGRLAVTEARVTFEDASLERPFATVVGPLTFALQDFHTVGDPNSPYQFEAVTGAGEQLAWRGTVSADPLKSQGELRLANVDLARLSPYYHTRMSGELRSALLDVSGRYAFEFKPEGPALTLADGELTLRDVRFGEAGSDEDALVLGRLAVSGVSADAATTTAAIGRVAIDGVDLKVVRDEAGIDLLRLLAPPEGTDEAEVAEFAGDASAEAVALPRITLGELSISGVRVEAIDLTTPRRAEHRIENLVLTLRDLDTADPGKALPLALEITLPKDGRVALNGTVAAVPAAAELDVELAGVPFANASPYVEPFLNIRLVDGVIRGAGRATLRDGAGSFAGDFGVAGFRAVDGGLAEDFLRWTDFSLTGIRAVSEPPALHVDEIVFVEPTAAVRIEEAGMLSIARAVSVKGADQADAGEAESAATRSTENDAAAAGPKPEVTIGRFAFERAAFRFEDRSIKPTARGGISDFTGAITGLTSETLGRADVDMRGKVDGVAPVAISGKLNPLGTSAFVDITVDFRGIDLQPGAGPYVGKFVGRELTRGSLNVAIKAKLDDRKLDTNNVVTLDQFFLGGNTNSPEATKLPVGLALALLRDTEGKIVVDLPVRGSLDDPNFKIGRVVIRVLTNILTKAATSPFSLLGAAFGGGGDELGWQDFEAGSAAPSEEGIKKLDTVAKALGARPALNLDIAGAYDPVLDGAALRLDRLERTVRAKVWEERRRVDPATESPELIEITDAERAEMSARLYAETFPGVTGERVTEADSGGEIARAAVAPVASAAVEAATTEAGARRQFGRLPRFNTGGATRAVLGEPVAALPEAAADPTGDPVETNFADSASAETAVMAQAPTLESMMLRLAVAMPVAETELEALGEARAQGIRAWLLETGKVPPDRVLMEPVSRGGMRATLNLR